MKPENQKTYSMGHLPGFMAFKATRDLIRVGRDNDGGYLVSASDIKAADALVALGINDDWSFESDFLKLNKVPVYAYDGSIGSKIFLKKFTRSLFRLKLKNSINEFITWLQYKRFFKEDVVHFEKYVTSISGAKNISMEDIFDAIDSDLIFLKIDIEGSEYRILQSLINNAEKITGLVIELHDCDLHLDKIQAFIERFPLKLIHIHANNFAPLSRNSIPLVLEFTFGRHSADVVEARLPHHLDMPNNSRKSEIVLKYF
jgi:hypothetical protein